MYKYKEYKVCPLVGVRPPLISPSTSHRHCRLLLPLPLLVSNPCLWLLTISLHPLSPMALKRKFSADFEEVDANTVCVSIYTCRAFPNMVSASSTAIQTPKQPRLFVPFPNSAELESDVNMSDAPSMELTLSIPPPMFHSRLSSTASSSSYTSFDSPRSSRTLFLEQGPIYADVLVSALYPTFELYPHEESQNQMSVDPGNYFDAATDSNSKSVGLIQPKGTSFTHHG